MVLNLCFRPNLLNSFFWFHHYIYVMRSVFISFRYQVVSRYKLNQKSQLIPVNDFLFFGFRNEILNKFNKFIVVLLFYSQIAYLFTN